jgi:hypothetical protein
MVRQKLRSVAEGLSHLQNLDAGEAKPFFQAALGAAFRLHTCLYTLADGDPPPPVGLVCQALIHALWATGEAGEDARKLRED